MLLRFIRTMSQSAIKIGTHDGTFHADEALACFMLKRLPEYQNAEIIRTRDQNLLDTCNIVVDVGGVYEPSKHRYDHHQKSFRSTIQTFRPDLQSEIRLSSAGLVYHHFGERVLQALSDTSLNSSVVDKMFTFVYFHLIQEIDAVDNGEPMYTVGEPRYGFSTHLSSRVARLNPDWNDKDITTSSSELFERAMQLTGEELEYSVKKFLTSWWPARSIVESAMDNRFKVHSSGEILEFNFCPWKSHVFDIEKEQGIEGTIKFAIFQDRNTWRTSTVPLTPGNFILRIPLHEEWQGVREAELQEKSGIPDAIFVHANGFIGGAHCREGALQLAVKTLEHVKKNNGK